MKKWNFKNILKEILSTLLIIFVISMVLNYIRKPDTSDKLIDIKALDIYQNEIDFTKLAKKDAPTIVHFWGF